MPKHVVLLVGTTKGAFFFHGDAERTSWRMTGPHLGGWEIYSLLGDRDGRVYAGTSHFVYGPTIRMSEDMGETWAEVGASPQYPAESGFKLKRIWQLAAGHASQPETLYAGVEEAGLFVSHDRGYTWQELSALTQHPSRPAWFPGGGGLCLHTILVDPRNAGRIWVGISAVGAFRTDDGGQSWKVCNTGLPSVPTGEGDTSVGRCVHKMVLDPQDSDTLYMQFHGGVFRSTDAGDSWHPIEEGLPGVFGFPMAITPSGKLFVIPLDSDEQRYVRDGRLEVYRSTDRGASWHAASVGLPEEPQFTGVLRDAMAVDPLDRAGVYFGTRSGKLFGSADEGETWTALADGLPPVIAVKTAVA